MARGGLNIEIEGIENVKKNVRREHMGPPLRRLFERAAAASSRDLRRGLSRYSDTEEAANSVEVKVDRRQIPKWGDAGATAKHARYIESGTRPHFPRIDGPLESWARRRGLDPYAVALVIARRGTKKRSIGRRAFFAARKRIQGYASDAVADIVRRMNGE